MTLHTKLTVFIGFVFIAYFADAIGRKTCVHLRNEFSVSIEQYEMCILKYSEPVRYCTMCLEPFKNFTASFKIFINAKDSKNNQTCESEYINLDEINMIQRIYNEAVAKWTSSSCSQCFDNSVLESDVNQTMSTVYESFMILITNLQKCVIVNSPAIACKNCLSAYTAASLVYSNIVSLTGNEHVCYDIKDAMNKTRNQWYNIWNCYVPAPTPLPNDDVTEEEICGIAAGLLSISTVIWVIYKKIVRSSIRAYEIIEGVSDSSRVAQSEGRLIDI